MVEQKEKIENICKRCQAKFWTRMPKDLCFSCEYSMLREWAEVILRKALEGLAREYE